MKSRISENVNNTTSVARAFGYGEVITEPDTVEFCIKIEKLKDSAEEARVSIAKRVDYLLQNIRNCQLQGNDAVSVHKVLEKMGEAFRLTADIVVRAQTLGQYESVRNLAVEKLGDAVIVSEPLMSHSPNCISKARQEAASLAVVNVRQKVQKMAALSNQHVGPAVLVDEEESTVVPVGDRTEIGCEFGALGFKQNNVVVSSKVYAEYKLVTNVK